MSVHERPATMAYDGRRRHLEEFLRSKQSGHYHRDLSIWADEQGLCTRTAKEYWRRAVWKGLIEINGDSWKWVGDYTDAHNSETPATDYMKKEKIKRLIRDAAK